MTDSMAIGLAAWIVQDGNYGDFAQGDIVPFAVEFHSQKLQHYSGNKDVAPSLLHLRGADHEATGNIVYISAKWWVLDVGFLIYREEEPPRGRRIGDCLQGRVSLGVDPFFYFERLAYEPGAPAAIYDWRIKKIEIETAPMLELHPRHFVRDQAKSARREIEATDAWTDDDGHGEYTLHCERLKYPARTHR